MLVKSPVVGRRCVSFITMFGRGRLQIHGENAVLAVAASLPELFLASCGYWLAYGIHTFGSSTLRLEGSFLLSRSAPIH